MYFRHCVLRISFSLLLCGEPIFFDFQICEFFLEKRFRSVGIEIETGETSPHRRQRSKFEIPITTYLFKNTYLKIPITRQIIRITPNETATALRPRGAANPSGWPLTARRAEKRFASAVSVRIRLPVCKQVRAVSTSTYIYL